MTGNPNGLSPTPSNWPNNPNWPVEKVSWNDAQRFFERLNSLEQDAGRLPDGAYYTLPTDAEWEYACRAGTTSEYSWGDDVTNSMAKYNSSQPTNVGSYPANPWGFHDMHGNVYEWCGTGGIRAAPGVTLPTPKVPPPAPIKSSVVDRGWIIQIP